MSRYYSRAGHPITLEEWCATYEDANKRVAAKHVLRALAAALTEDPS